MRRTFQSGNRFWSIENNGKKVVTRWGVVGGKLRSQTRVESSRLMVDLTMAKQVADKRRGGYRETTFRDELPLGEPVAQGLMAALKDDPDDLSARMAFADWLSEQADDRLTAWGEFMRLQLASRGEPRKRGGRTAAQRRLFQLQEDYEIQWLGKNVARALLPLMDETGWACESRRDYEGGWLTRLSIPFLRPQMVKRLRRAPALCLVRELELDAVQRRCDLQALAQADWLGNVRRLTVVSESPLAGLTDLVEKMPKLQTLQASPDEFLDDGLFSLPTLSELRTLEVVGPARIPTARIAANPALRQLRRLALNAQTGPHLRYSEPGALGAEDLRQICGASHLQELRELLFNGADVEPGDLLPLVESGILARLELLDLCGCNLGDAHAEVLAASPDFRRVRKVRLGGNFFSRATAARLGELNPGVLFR